MSQRSSTTRPRTYWTVPAICVVAGFAYLAAAWHGGHPALGAGMLAIMLAFAVVVLLAARHSETVRHLLDRRDERITALDLRATAAAGAAVIVAVLVGAVAELARGHSGAPYIWLAAVGGVAYLAAIVVGRLRG